MADRAAQIRATPRPEGSRRLSERGRTFGFDQHAHYAHATVKEALRTAQHDKCAFCESKVSHVSPGDVEHFRPKAGYRQLRRGPLQRPGYYWLAYAWENLLFVCELCNQREKGSWFPLEKGSKRARSPKHRLANERALFVDPSREDPSGRPGLPRARRDRCRREQAREDHPPGLGLNRVALKARRRDYLDVVHKLYALVVEPPGTPLKEEAKNLLRRMAAPDAEYSRDGPCLPPVKGFDPNR